MEHKKAGNDKNHKNDLSNKASDSSEKPYSSVVNNNQSDNVSRIQSNDSSNIDVTPIISQKPTKPPKLEDKPFDEFISKHLIPDLKKSIQEKGTIVKDIKLIKGNRPVVGGSCWMLFCEISEQRRFWLCFNKDLITSDKTILLAESNSDPSIVESFLIDEKKTTLPLLISRVLQRLNGQKWIGAN